jgi:NAD(P)-dependent dehydrogenase (short-subunit alcohol dehydrogenase family)
MALAGRDTAAIESVAADIRTGGGKALVVACDVTDAAQCEAAVKAAIAVYGRLDILVNVAGGSGPIGKTGAETTPDEFRDIVDLNMTGCFNTIRAALPTMMVQRYGKIVNVGGTFGMRGRAGRLGYSASKWGLRGITKSFALEAGPYNINVNYVAPGMVDGPRFRDKVCADMAKRLGITVEEAAQRHAADYALKRVSTDEDVANACLFLASDVSRQITGVDLPVDGGWAML